MNQRAPRVGLVLGGGGIAGYAFHAAALGALQHVTDWDPRTAEVIVGTSAGSGVTALLRGGVSVKAMLTRLLTVPTDPESMAALRQVSGRGASLFQLGVGPAAPKLVMREMLRGRKLRPSRVLAGMLPKGPINSELIGQAAAELHGAVWPDRETWITAVDLSTGRLEVFGRSTSPRGGRVPDPRHGGDGLEAPVDMATAVRASCAIPGFFSPVKANGRRYVDGGVHSMNNAELVAGLGLDLVVVISPMSMSQVVATSPISSSIRLLPSMQVRNEVNYIREIGANVLLIEPCDSVVRTVGPNPMDATRALPILLEANSSVYRTLTDAENVAECAILRAAAEMLESPPDVPHPEVVT